MKVIQIPVVAIESTGRLRPVNWQAVEGLVRSIRRDVLRQPVEVVKLEGRMRWRLVAGAHRLAAIAEIGDAMIDAVEVDGDEADLRRLELMENLARNELTKLERCRFVAELKSIHQAANPTAQRGGDRRCFHALEAVNIDGHTWDVAVRWPDVEKPVRPIMVAIQDLYATSPIGQPCKLKIAADGTVTFEINGVVAHTFAVSATGKTVRFSIGCPNTALDLDDISITAGGDPENFTLISTSFEAWAEPAKGFWLGLAKPVDAVTYGADYLVDLSKDDGVTWEAVTISKIGETVITVNGTPTTVDVVYGELTFAASGDQTVRTRTRGANNKECQSHGAIREVE